MYQQKLSEAIRWANNKAASVFYLVQLSNKSWDYLSTLDYLGPIQPVRILRFSRYAGKWGRQDITQKEAK